MTVAAFIPSSTTSHVGDTNYPGRLTLSFSMTCFFGLLATLMFGYEVGVSGGLLSMPQFLKFVNKSIEFTNQYCLSRNEFFSTFTSSTYLAAFVGSIVGSHLTYKGGFLLSNVLICNCFTFGPIFCFAETAYLFVGRILLGLGVGAVCQSVPLCLSEIVPCRHRGIFKFSFPLMISVGILGANLMNLAMSKLDGETGWRLSSGGFTMVLGIVFLLGVLLYLIGVEPSLIIRWGSIAKAEQTLVIMRGTDDVAEEFGDLLKVNEAVLESQQTWRTILKRKYRPHLVMALAIPFFQQFTGINVIILYGPILAKALGFGTIAALKFAVITGGVNVLATVFAIAIVDKMKRKLLFLAGGAMMFICQILLGGGAISNWHPYVLLALVCMYLLGFVCSWGVAGWLVPGEIFPLEIRSKGHYIIIGLSFFYTFVIAQFFLSLFCKLKFGVFYVFAAFVFTMTIFVIFFLPETKGIHIKEMTNVWKQHWFWKRYVTDDDVEGEQSESGLRFLLV